MKQLAIIGPTASGKSALSLELAKEFNAIILSIDSLSIYHKIDIASAKPSKEELSSVLHFGIDALSPDQHANVITFIDEYRKARSYAEINQTNLIIIGGSSFYLKSMLDGLSDVPAVSESVRQKVTEILVSTDEAHRLLHSIDPLTASKIDSNDRYRLEKMLHLYFETSTPPTQWFSDHPPQPILENCSVLNLTVDRELLRRRIDQRTHLMVQNGLIDEVAYLDKTYGRLPNSMKAIGIVETLQFLDGNLDRQGLIDAISTHTAQLAKRQTTFNSYQFQKTLSGSEQELYGFAKEILA